MAKQEQVKTMLQLNSLLKQQYASLTMRLWEADQEKPAAEADKDAVDSVKEVLEAVRSHINGLREAMGQQHFQMKVELVGGAPTVMAKTDWQPLYE